MAVSLPPIDETSFDQHQTEQVTQRAQADLAALETAHAAQQQAEQDRALAVQQRAQAQIAEIDRVGQDAAEAQAVTQRARAQVDAITAPRMPAGLAPSLDTGSGLGRVYADARAAGLDDEGARAAVAVAATEGGMSGAAGDQGVSAGTFQLHHAGGQGTNYARALGISPQESIARLRQDPHAANQWALGGYLGQAIREGQARGLRGAELATYAQQVGQRSVSPERAGVGYQAAQEALGGPPTPSGTFPGVEGVSRAFQPQFEGQKAVSRAEAVGQFEQGLDYAEAAAICGPVAALAFVQANGRNPSLAEVRALATRRGWTQAGGMNGVANEQALLSDLGVQSRLDTAPDFGEIAQDAASGNPVIISTPVHYYYANAYDPQTGRVFVGKTGTSRRGGGAWMTPQQIAELDGGINGVLYVDNPRSPAPSIAAATTEGERPPSEFEPPSAFPASPFERQVPEITGPVTVAGATTPTAPTLPSPAGGHEPPEKPWVPPRRVELEDVGFPGELRPEYERVSAGRPGPMDVLAATDVPNRVGFALAHAALTGQDPAQAILETAREGGRAPSGEDLLAAAGVPESEARRIAGRAVDFAADYRNVLPGLVGGGRISAGRQLVAEPLGAAVGGEAGGEIGERIGGPTGRVVGEVAGALLGAGAAGARYQAVAGSPAARRLGITPGGGEQPGWRMTPGAFLAGRPGVIQGDRGAAPGATGTEHLGGTYVAQDPGYASYFATAEPGAALQRVEITTDKPFVLTAGDNAERLAEAEARLGGRPTSEAVDLARSYRERGMSYVSPQARRWLSDQGYDAVVVHKDLGVPGELGPVAISLDPAKVRFAGETLDYQAVRAALARGEPVPPEVLADYPDLAPAAVAPGAPPRPPLEPPTATAGAPEPVPEPRLPIWMQPSERVAPLEPVAGARPGEGLAATVETAGRTTPPRVPTEVGQQRAVIEVTPSGVATERALARPTPALGERLGTITQDVMRAAYDRTYPLRELDALAGNDPLAGAHAAAQVVPGAVAAGEDHVRRAVIPLLRALGPDVRTLERYWFLKSAEDLAARDPAVRLPGGVVGPAGVQTELQTLAAKVGPERMARVGETAQQLWALNDDLRLKPLRDAGLISPEQYHDYRVNNPHYLPFHRYDYAGEGVGHLLPPRGPASAGEVDLGRRSLVGSTRALDDPVSRWMADLIDTQKRVFQNRAAVALVDGLRRAQEAGHDLGVVTGTPAALERAGAGRVTRDRGVVRFFDPAHPGVEQVADVPHLYAEVAKGLEAEPTNAFLRLLSAAAAPLRVGATTLSLSFLPRNIGRDFQSAYVKEGIKLWSPEMLAGWKAAIARNADFSEAAQAGALQSGLLESRRTQDVLKRAQQLRGGITVRSPADAVMLLPRLLGKAVSPVMRANEIAEQAPRLATFIKARAAAAPSLEAAVRARDVTVDFSKSGNFVRMLNQMVPFLNARVQGTANTVRLFRDNPAQASARVVAPTAFLSTAAYLWNKRYESSASIPESDWDRNWIFQFGEAEEAPDPRMPNAPPQKIPLYVKIPKGDAAAIASAPIEAMLRLADAQNDRSAAELFLRAGSAATRGLSPVEPTAAGLTGVVTPPIAATAGALQANYDPFRQRAIVPEGEQARPPREQFGPETSETAVGLGRTFGVSPRLLEHAIKSYTGGAGGQALWALDLGLGALSYHPEVPGEARRQPRTLAEEAARAPGVSGLVGALNIGPQALGRERFNRAVNETQRAFYDLPDTRRLGLSFGPVADTVENVVLEPAERVDYQRRALEYATDNLDRVQSRARYENADDATKRALAADAIAAGRAKAAAEILKEIPRDLRRERRRVS